MQLGKALKARATFLSVSKFKTNARTAYKIFRFIKAVNENGVEFYKTEHDKIIKKYAHEMEGGTARVTEDKIDAFVKENAELEAVEIDVPSVSFSLSELDEVKLSAADIENIIELIKEDGNEAH